MLTGKEFIVQLEVTPIYTPLLIIITYSNKINKDVKLYSNSKVRY